MKTKTVDKVVELDVNRIVPNPAQPRKTFDRNELLSLADSISKNGLLQPILVRKISDGKFQLISGERRLRAVRHLGHEKIRAMICDADSSESAVWAIIENIQRKDLSCFEEAKAINSLITVWGISQDAAAQKLGKAQSTVANKLRLLRISEELQEKIEKNGLTERHARALLQITDPVRQAQALESIIIRKMNVAQAEKFIESKLSPKKQEAPKIYMVKDLRIFINTINHAVETMVNSGIEATASSSESEDFYEYVVRVPKKIAISSGK